jgi:maltose alpha-D-glucosyltransferase/alpha-amylase
MQIYERGLRRRLAPMLGGDRRRILLAHSLLFTLPGTPVLWFGDEIGMGEDLSLPERDPVRTPMQWSHGPNAGFSTAPGDHLFKPVVSMGEYAFEKVNVERARRDPDSLLNCIERMIRRRKECPELGHGTWRELSTGGNHTVLAHVCESDRRMFIAVHNLGSECITITLDLPDHTDAKAIDLLSNADANLHGGPLQLEPYGFRWFRLQPV